MTDTQLTHLRNVAEKASKSAPESLKEESVRVAVLEAVDSMEEAASDARAFQLH